MLILPGTGIPVTCWRSASWISLINEHPSSYEWWFINWEQPLELSGCWEGKGGYKQTPCLWKWVDLFLVLYDLGQGRLLLSRGSLAEAPAHLLVFQLLSVPVEEQNWDLQHASPLLCSAGFGVARAASATWHVLKCHQLVLAQGKERGFGLSSTCCLLWL